MSVKKKKKTDGRVSVVATNNGGAPGFKKNTEGWLQQKNINVERCKRGLTDEYSEDRECVGVGATNKDSECVGV